MSCKPGCLCEGAVPTPTGAVDAPSEAEIERLAKIIYDADEWGGVDFRTWERRPEAVQDRYRHIARAVAIEAVAKVAGERDRWRRRALDEIGAHEEADRQLQDARARLAETEAARGRLRPWIRHAMTCPVVMWTFEDAGGKLGPGPCNCGLRAALAATGEEGEAAEGLCHVRRPDR